MYNINEKGLKMRLPSIFQIIGNTPLVKLKYASEKSGCTILAKCEFLNPGGSIKDRAGKQILIDALENGHIESGDTIIEATAGNTGISLTILANALGLKTIIVMPETQALAKKDILRNLGAQLILTPACPLSDPRNFRNTAQRLSIENNWFLCDQFNNPSNAKAHTTTTVPEIIEQTGGDIDGFICTVGTGGSLGGIASGLTKYNKNIKIGIVDPDGAKLYSYYKNGTFESNGSSFMEGIGQVAVTPQIKDLSVDYAYNISDKEAMQHAYDCIEHDGLNIGLSSALNIAGAMVMAHDMGKGHTIVTLLCDTSDKYKEKMFNKDFLFEKEIPVPHWIK